MDRQNSKLLCFQTCSPIGSLPLTNLISSSESEETLSFAFELLKSILPKYAFYGRGPSLGPKLIVTDDSTSERNSLQKIWPDAWLLLCIYYVLAANWSYLWEGKNGIEKNDWPHLLKKFKDIVYAHSLTKMQDNLEVFSQWTVTMIRAKTERSDAPTSQKLRGGSLRPLSFQEVGRSKLLTRKLLVRTT